MLRRGRSGGRGRDVDVRIQAPALERFHLDDDAPVAGAFVGVQDSQRVRVHVEHLADHRRARPREDHGVADLGVDLAVVPAEHGRAPKQPVAQETLDHRVIAERAVNKQPRKRHTA